MPAGAATPRVAAERRGPARLNWGSTDGIATHVEQRRFVVHAAPVERYT
jgi:hypothetical protein